MSAVFVTGSGTDIGKTFVTAGLIRHLRRRGRSVAALKPVASGFDPAHPEASDAAVLLAALGRPATIDEIARISPWRFRAPLSPDLAAQREARTLDFAAVLAFSRREIAAAADILLIEGVGGAMVPLDEAHTVLDWMAQLAAPALLVTGSYLGAISHTLTALAVLKQRAVAVRAIVVNESAASSVTLADTAAVVTRFAQPAPVIGLPRLLSTATDHPAFAQVARAIDGQA